ncbi:MAG: hypothetical protein Q4G71_07795 [Pseudomonadota bacterium]|nr:hypothetical protein [Pseudomonadota bacterium]
MAKSFDATTISSGQTRATLTITLTRNAGAAALTGVAFNDAFPADLLAEDVLTNTCGAPGSATVSPTGVQLTGGVIDPLANSTALSRCVITVRVGATAGASGVRTNTLAAGAVTTAEGVSNRTAASANVTLSAAGLA